MFPYFQVKKDQLPDCKMKNILSEANINLAVHIFFKRN